MNKYFAFIDESRNGRYTLCLLRVDSAKVSQLRKSMLALRKRGQTRFHMKQESDQRRREILSQLNSNGDWDALILQSNKASRVSPETRQKLFLLMAQHSKWQAVAELVVEDSTDNPRDRKTLTWLLNNGAHKFTYSFKKPSQDPGLWAADAVVWAYAKGGAWRDEVCDRVEHVVAP